MPARKIHLNKFPDQMLAGLKFKGLLFFSRPFFIRYAYNIVDSGQIAQFTDTSVEKRGLKAWAGTPHC